MNKFKLFFLFIFFVLCFIKPQQASASVLFFDDFSNGKSNWTPVMGDPNLWQISKNIPGVPDGMYGGIINQPNTIIDSVAGNINTQNYIIEFDMLPISGVDRNIDFRWVNGITKYELHFNNPNGTNYLNSGYITNIHYPVSYYPTDNVMHHFKITLNNNHIIINMDGTNIADTIDPNFQFTGPEQVGLRIGTGSVYPTEVWFDNVKVSSIDTDLNVPLLKQTTPPWASQPYASAYLWAPKNQTSISNWGCAITSAAMVFQYYGITKLPNGQTLDPGTINSWLKSQPDGYLGHGQVNWLALSRLSKLAKPKNPNFGYDALEFALDKSADTAQLTTDINNSEPDILEEPGHFVVGKGINGNTFDINDPAYNRNTLNGGYNNTFLSLRRFIPSNTDLSYILATAGSGDHLSLTNSSGQNVGQEYLQQPVTDTSNPSQESGNYTQELYLQNPGSDDYKLHVVSDNDNYYDVNIYSYDSDGEVVPTKIHGIISDKSIADTVTINYSKTDNSTTITKKLTFNDLIKDINQLKKRNLIENDDTEFALLTIANSAKTAKNNGKIENSKNLLQSMVFLINNSKKLEMRKRAKNVVIDDATSLISLLSENGAGGSSINVSAL